MNTSGPAPAGALCALHPGVSADRVCGRCGNFMCGACSEQGAQGWCPSCRATAGVAPFPLSRDDYDFGRVWDLVWAAFSREWLMLSVAVVIFFAVATAGGLVGNVVQLLMQAASGNHWVGVVVGQLVSQAINMVVQGVVMLGLYRLTLDALAGRRVDLARLITQARKVGRYLLAQLILFALVLPPVAAVLGAVGAVAWKLLGLQVSELRGLSPEQVMFLPALWAVGAVVVVVGLVAFFVASPLLFVPLELVYGDAGPWEAVKRSWNLGQGHRLWVFLYTLLGVLISMASVLACCVGLLPGYALYLLLFTALYLALRNGSGLPAPPEP